MFWSSSVIDRYKYGGSILENDSRPVSVIGGMTQDETSSMKIDHYWVSMVWLIPLLLLIVSRNVEIELDRYAVCRNSTDERWLRCARASPGMELHAESHERPPEPGSHDEPLPRGHLCALEMM